MRNIGPDLPTLWWLNPWSHVRYLHRAAVAMHGLVEKQASALDVQDAVIDALEANIIRGCINADARPIVEDCES